MYIVVGDKLIKCLNFFNLLMGNSIYNVLFGKLMCDYWLDVW